MNLKIRLIFIILISGLESEDWLDMTTDEIKALRGLLSSDSNMV